MPGSPFHVLIIGGGPGGLCLAQGLQQAGVSVDKSWQSAPITLLGDAIHAMSPAGGSGANMALLDARLLCQTLISIAHAEKPLLQAIHEYEAQMLKDGFEAVRFSARGGILSTVQPAKKSLLQRVFSSQRIEPSGKL